tara:strand:- start:159 stop:527 length:369 start_codon:yes stop_codon:yes gene_type:complete
MIITKILNFIHILLLLVPIVIYFFKKKLIKPYSHWILLVAAYIPLHWVFFNDSCVFTDLSIAMGDYQESETTSEFSENNLKWLYLPIMKMFGWEWNSLGLDKIVTLHWIINIFLIWYYCFYF